MSSTAFEFFKVGNLIVFTKKMEAKSSSELAYLLKIHFTRTKKTKMFSVSRLHVLQISKKRTISFEMCSRETLPPSLKGQISENVTGRLSPASALVFKLTMRP